MLLVAGALWLGGGLALLGRAGRLADPTLSGMVGAVGMFLGVWGGLHLVAGWGLPRSQRAWPRVLGFVVAGLGIISALGLALLILTSPLPGWLLGLRLAGVLMYGGVVVGLARFR